MRAQKQDTKTFHNLINKSKANKCSEIQELHFNENIYSDPDDILEGWNAHFKNLATSEYDTNSEDYTNREFDLHLIQDICANSDSVIKFDEHQVEKTIQKLNKNKAPDIFGIMAEHVIFGGNMLIYIITSIFNRFAYDRSIPNCLKEGLLTPVFKKKGLKTDAKNYRGITVLPVFEKIFELLLKERLLVIIHSKINKLQRGFTVKVAPLYAALLLQEIILNALFQNKPIYIGLLDAKSAFDVVRLTSLYRKLYLNGVDGPLWNLIYQLSTYATTTVKWNNMLSDPFSVCQGVRQGGILSTELYKIYINDVLNQLEESGLGAHIGAINCGAPTCADDLALLSEDPIKLQTMISTVENYSRVEGYKLQPTKSIILRNEKNPRKLDHFQIDSKIMPESDKSVHLGIICHKEHRKTISTNIQENIKKARRTMYSLMGAGLHGINGLTPTAALHIYNTYMSFQYYCMVWKFYYPLRRI